MFANSAIVVFGALQIKFELASNIACQEADFEIPKRPVASWTSLDAVCYICEFCREKSCLLDFRRCQTQIMLFRHENQLQA